VRRSAGQLGLCSCPAPTVRACRGMEMATHRRKACKRDGSRDGSVSPVERRTEFLRQVARQCWRTRKQRDQSDLMKSSCWTKRRCPEISAWEPAPLRPGLSSAPRSPLWAPRPCLPGAGIDSPGKGGIQQAL